MPQGKVTAMNHTSFTVGELDRVTAFFADLGLEVIHLRAASRGVMEGFTRVDGAEVRVAYVKGPGHQIELFEYSGPPDRGKARPRPCDVGAAHVAFEVDDLAAIVARAARHGFHPLRTPVMVDMTTLDTVPAGEKPRGQGLLNCYLRDADGLTIELMEYV
jgi:catechol 2,3-dioxygenase-like lactoylglutathione lyase family enzyme